MKKAVLPEYNTFLPKAARPDNYYGVRIGDKRGIVMNNQHHQHKFFFVFDVFSITRGYSLYGISGSLEEVIHDVLARDGEIFEFETHKELFKWLSE